MSVYREIACPRCGDVQRVYANPLPTVDIVIETAGGIVLVRRRNPPHGWALPGGFVDYGETVETAALREAMEETGLEVRLKGVLGVYSDPLRDPRRHTLSVVFVADSDGDPRAGDDAAEVTVCDAKNIAEPLCFDHEKIIKDYLEYMAGGRCLASLAVDQDGVGLCP